MATLGQRSFAGGEITPALYSRVDQIKYQTGARTLRNMYVMKHGGAISRQGTEFVAEVKDSTKTVRLIPFEFSNTQTCMLEFGDGYMRIHQNGAQVIDITPTISGISNANPCTITAASHGLVTGEEVTLSGVVGAIGTYLNGRNFKVGSFTTNQFTIEYMDGTAVDSTAFGAYTSGGTASRIYTITSPFAYADLPTLRYAQSGDVITFAHPNYDPQKLTRSGPTSWAFSTFAPASAVSAPSGIGIVITSGTGTTENWDFAVTALSDETGEESLPETMPNTAVNASFTDLKVFWTAVAGCSTYRVYAGLSGMGIQGLVGIGGSGANSWKVLSAMPTPDYTQNPPITRNPFSGSSNRPSCVGYMQQRLWFGNAASNTEGVWGSQIGRYNNFNRSFPLKDDDAVTFTRTGQKINPIKHLLELDRPLVFTQTSEHVLFGDASTGSITPSLINPKRQSGNGISDLPPLDVNGNALYVQALGNVVRDFSFEFTIDKYTGNDLTVFSSHLFDNYTLVDWAYQQIPHSVVWAVRSDGILLSLTYMREHQILAWARHDTPGVVENVAVIPEGTEHKVYLVVRRTINGETKRYVERMSSRLFTDIRDFVGMDCALSVDGRNTGATTMTLTTGAGWTENDTLTLTASTSFFASTDVGKEIHIDLTSTDVYGNVTVEDTIRCAIKAYTSATVVSVTPQKTVPAGLQGVAVTAWRKAITALSGLWPLEGQEVSILADGFVEGSPNNSAYTTKTVTNGQITLDFAHAVIHVGLPFLSDVETLDIDTANGEPIVDKEKYVGQVTMHVQDTRGVWAGPQPPTDDSTDPLEGLSELKIRSTETYEQPVRLVKDQQYIPLDPEWTKGGRVFIRQVDPLPMVILSVFPAGYFPMRAA